LDNSDYVYLLGMVKECRKKHREWAKKWRTKKNGT